MNKIVRDIVDQLVKIEKTNLFVLPWHYEMKMFIGDNANRAKYIKEQISTEMDAKIDTLQTKMEENKLGLSCAKLKSSLG